MELYHAIRNRCSVRSYLDKPVEQDKLVRILDAGRLAPSGNNRQEWKFVVVRQAQLRQELAQACEQPWIAEAPVLVAVVGCNPGRLMSCEVPADPVDCAIAMSYMMLAVEAEGLGTCWIGHFSQPQCKALLNVPESAQIIGLLPIGYAAQRPGPRRRKPLGEIVTDEKY